MSQDKSNNAQYSMRTRLIHGNSKLQLPDYNHHIVPPISASAAYELDSVHRGAQGFAEYASDNYEGNNPIYIYERLDEPTRGMLEHNLASAEGAHMAVCFASGMAAISAAIGVTTTLGDEIVSHHTLYGCTYSLFSHWLPRQGVSTKFVDLRSLTNFDSWVSEKTRVVYLESPVNPTLDLIDIAELRRRVDVINSSRSEDRRILIVVDNTFATPYCQRPLSLGADLVVHSLTKNIGGFGTDMGGAVIGGHEFHETLLMYRKDFGGALSPKSAWQFLVYGLPTLATRMAAQQKTAMLVAQFLEQHSAVAKVIYPGLASFPQLELAKRQMISYDRRFAPGSMIYFILKGDTKTANAAAENCMDFIAKNATAISLAVSLGQIRTLIESPFCMTHAALPEAMKLEKGLVPGGIRMSIGLEDWHDLVADLDAALEFSRSANVVRAL